MGSSVLLHYFRNRVASRVSAMRCIIPPGYLVFGALDTSRITSSQGRHYPSIRALVEKP